MLPAYTTSALDSSGIAPLSPSWSFAKTEVTVLDADRKVERAYLSSKSRIFDKLVKFDSPESLRITVSSAILLHCNNLKIEGIQMLEERFPSHGNGNRRDRIVLFSTMLSRADKGIRKTELMYKVGLSSSQFDRYMPVLTGCGLLQESSRGKKAFYVTTEKGKRFVDKYGILVRMLEFRIKDDSTWNKTTNPIFASHLSRRPELRMPGHTV